MTLVRRIYEFAITMIPSLTIGLKIHDANFESDM